MSAPTPSPAPPRRRWLRRNLLPLLAVGVPAAVRLVLTVITRTEVGVEAIFPLTLAFNFATLFGLILLAVWFFLLAGYSAATRLAVAGLILAAAGGVNWAVRGFEFDGQMVPHARFRWQPADADVLAAHLATTTRAADPTDLSAGPADSPAYRGPAGDGSAPGVDLLPDWAARPPKVLWRHPVGGGHAGVAVAGNGAVTLEQRGADEAVVCYDRLTGKERWVHTYPALFSTSAPMGGDGPRTTPAIAGGDVFALGATGDLVCLAGATGSPKWAVNILADNGATNLPWAMSGSPVVVGDVVVVNPGVDPAANAGKAVAAYNCSTGAKVWANGRYAAGYASPQRVTLGGKDQVLVFDAAGLGGYDPAGGAELWRHAWKTDMGMNSAQPVVVGPDRVFVSSEKSNGGAVVEITPGSPWQAHEVWHTRALSARYCSPVVHAGHVFGLGDGRLTCVDLATGKRAWSEGDYGNGQIIRAGNILIITSEKGRVDLAAADPAEYHSLGSMDLFPDRTWNVPAMAGNQLFVRNHREMACLELPVR